MIIKVIRCFTFCSLRVNVRESEVLKSSGSAQNNNNKFIININILYIIFLP
jgi:hypothetical protein